MTSLLKPTHQYHLKAEFNNGIFSGKAEYHQNNNLKLNLTLNPCHSCQNELIRFEIVDRPLVRSGGDGRDDRSETEECYNVRQGQLTQPSNIISQNIFINELENGIILNSDVNDQDRPKNTIQPFYTIILYARSSSLTSVNSQIPVACGTFLPVGSHILMSHSDHDQYGITIFKTDQMPSMAVVKLKTSDISTAETFTELKEHELQLYSEDKCSPDQNQNTMIMKKLFLENDKFQSLDHFDQLKSLKLTFKSKEICYSLGNSFDYFSLGGISSVDELNKNKNYPLLTFKNSLADYKISSLNSMVEMRFLQKSPFSPTKVILHYKEINELQLFTRFKYREIGDFKVYDMSLNKLNGKIQRQNSQSSSSSSNFFTSMLSSPTTINFGVGCPAKLSDVPFFAKETGKVYDMAEKYGKFWTFRGQTTVLSDFKLNFFPSHSNSNHPNNIINKTILFFDAEDPNLIIDCGMVTSTFLDQDTFDMNRLMVIMVTVMFIVIFKVFTSFGVNVFRPCLCNVLRKICCK